MKVLELLRNIRTAVLSSADDTETVKGASTTNEKQTLVSHCCKAVTLKNLYKFLAAFQPAVCLSVSHTVSTTIQLQSMAQTQRLKLFDVLNLNIFYCCYCSLFLFTNLPLAPKESLFCCLTSTLIHVESRILKHEQLWLRDIERHWRERVQLMKTKWWNGANFINGNNDVEC